MSIIEDKHPCPNIIYPIDMFVKALFRCCQQYCKPLRKIVKHGLHVCCVADWALQMGDITQQWAGN